MSALKVYRLTLWNYDCPPAQNRNRQCEHVVAARSATEAARMFGVSAYLMKTYGGQTGNAESIAVAMAEPGVVFWKAEHFQGTPGPKEWQRIEPNTAKS